MSTNSHAGTLWREKTNGGVTCRFVQDAYMAMTLEPVVIVTGERSGITFVYTAAVFYARFEVAV